MDAFAKSPKRKGRTPADSSVKGEAEAPKEASKGATPEAAQFGMAAIGVSPPSIEISGKAGTQVSTTVKVDNPSRKYPLQAFITPVGVVLGSDGKLQIKPIPSLPPDNIARNITLEAKTLIIPAGSHKNMTISFVVPSSLKGSQYMRLRFSAGGEAPSGEALKSTEYVKSVGVGMQAAIDVRVLLNVEGTLNYALALKDLKLLSKKGNLPVSARAVFQNTGNAELKFSPLLILMKDGNVVARMKTEGNVTVIPGGINDVNFQPVVKDIPAGSYKAILTVVSTKIKLPPIERTVVLK